MAAKAPRKKAKGKGSWSSQILLIFVLLTAIVFLPTTMLVLFGMLPTVVAVLIDRQGGTRAVTVGSMNLAGCFPFLLDLWTKSHTAEYAGTLITDPRTIIVIYAAAGMGYLIDWALSGIVATIMMQRATLRLAQIRKRQAAMVIRWGKEVTGEVVLDPEGFPLEEEKA
ncbi:MAG: hypothetical protein NDJ24_06410 [Alphaproteobacteria bacterium]|nr:hypothetical protein [Alphaproteobacteria bacterium]